MYIFYTNLTRDNIFKTNIEAQISREKQWPLFFFKFLNLIWRKIFRPASRSLIRKVLANQARWKEKIKTCYSTHVNEATHRKQLRHKIVQLALKIVQFWMKDIIFLTNKISCKIKYKFTFSFSASSYPKRTVISQCRVLIRRAQNHTFVLLILWAFVVCLFVFQRWFVMESVWFSSMLLYRAVNGFLRWLGLESIYGICLIM